MSGDLLRRAGEALYGLDWRGELAAALGVNETSVKNWARGASRVPPGVWKDVANLLHAEVKRLLDVRNEAILAAVKALERPPS